MRRSSMGSRARPSGSSNSARVVPRATRTPAALALTAFPHRRKRLSDGVLVEASILARVLGLRLLTLEATVVLAPADVVANAAARPSGRGPRPPRVVGRGLAEAARTIDQGSEVLAEARRNDA